MARVSERAEMLLLLLLAYLLVFSLTFPPFRGKAFVHPEAGNKKLKYLFISSIEMSIFKTRILCFTTLLFHCKEMFVSVFHSVTTIALSY